jgi:antitoxin YefM
MLAELTFTDARRELTSVIDRVQRMVPVVIRPRKQSEENTFILNETMVRIFLSQYTFNLSLIDEEEGSYGYWLDNLDIYGYGETKEEALDSLVEELIIYAKQYTDNPSRYIDAPNRRVHLPYVMRVMVCNDAEEVKRLLLQDGSAI